jgi:hypothetical protein
MTIFPLSAKRSLFYRTPRRQEPAENVGKKPIFRRRLAADARGFAHTGSLNGLTTRLASSALFAQRGRLSATLTSKVPTKFDFWAGLLASGSFD